MAGSSRRNNLMIIGLGAAKDLTEETPDFYTCNLVYNITNWFLSFAINRP